MKLLPILVPIFLIFLIQAMAHPRPRRDSKCEKCIEKCYNSNNPEKCSHCLEKHCTDRYQYPKKRGATCLACAGVCFAFPEFCVECIAIWC